MLPAVGVNFFCKLLAYFLFYNVRLVVNRVVRRGNGDIGILFSRLVKKIVSVDSGIEKSAVVFPVVNIPVSVPAVLFLVCKVAEFGLNILFIRSERFGHVRTVFQSFVNAEQIGEEQRASDSVGYQVADVHIHSRAAVGQGEYYKSVRNGFKQLNRLLGVLLKILVSQYRASEMHNGDILGYVFGQKVLLYLLAQFDKTDSERVVSLNLLNKRLF